MKFIVTFMALSIILAWFRHSSLILGIEFGRIRIPPKNRKIFKIGITKIRMCISGSHNASDTTSCLGDDRTCY